MLWPLIIQRAQQPSWAQRADRVRALTDRNSLRIPQVVRGGKKIRPEKGPLIQSEVESPHKRKQYVSWPPTRTPGAEGLQLHGGAGYMDEYLISRMYRDARVQTIYGGTNEIMKELISRTL